MRRIIYIIIVILVVGWLLGLFAFHVHSHAIHIVLVLAAVLFIVNIVNGGADATRGRWY
ncbi:MAG TPA: lmo0937 family membrane protein [Mucilaginibacter sp.]|nr:lmo0937 family membrane protein [Mucilaginibacter sp.]